LNHQAIGAGIVERDGLADQIRLRVVIGDIAEGGDARIQVVFEAAVGVEAGAAGSALLVKIDVVVSLGICRAGRLQVYSD
jgi:hypothetical protein